MLEYHAKITSPSGHISDFHLKVDINENGRTGELLWEGETCPLKNYHADPFRNTLSCQLKWLGNYVRTRIVSSEVEGKYILSIQPIGQPFDYYFFENNYSEFHEFLEKIHNFSNQNSQTGKDFDDLIESVSGSIKKVCLYAGSNIYKNTELLFRSISANGFPLDVNFPKPLPQGLGIYFPLGMFAQNEVIEVKWTFEIEYASYGTSIVVGAYRDSLKHRTLLETIKVEPYRSYSSKALVKV